MARVMLVSVAAAAFAAGCTPAYRVHVNTYVEPGRTVSRSASVYVAGDPNSPNPILSRQIVSKIAQVLEGYGYRSVGTRAAGDYILTFTAGIDSERVMEYTSLYRPYGGLYGGYFGGWGLGYTTYLPYIGTVYTHWLRMRLYKAKADATGDEGLVWLGEAMTGTESPELREAINYLLIACIEYLGEDTAEWVAMKIEKDDPRILRITGHGPIE